MDGVCRRLQLSLRELWRVIRFGFPNGLNWFGDFAAFQLFVNVVFASLGDDTLAALNVVIAINSLAFMPAFGLASAGAILAGQAIGAGQKDAVGPQVKLTISVAAVWMCTIGATYLLAPHPAPTSWSDASTAARWARCCASSATSRFWPPSSRTAFAVARGAASSSSSPSWSSSYAHHEDTKPRAIRVDRRAHGK
ncbi:MAG: MATE family efflux transporter [Myxococcota bacterium]|nr:MATE family efflux transporter [Myxococcota bacterium]